MRRQDPEHLRIERYRKDNDLNGYYRHSFKGTKIRYIQLLAPIAERAEGLLWLPRLVGYDAQNLPLFLTLPAEDNPADDPLRAVSPEGWRPYEQFVVPAVELTESKHGFEVAQHFDDHGELQPSIGLICEFSHNFLKPLLASDPDGKILQVKGTGSIRKPPKGAPRNPRLHQITEVTDALPLDLHFDFDQALQRHPRPITHRQSTQRSSGLVPHAESTAETHTPVRALLRRGSRCSTAS